MNAPHDTPRTDERAGLSGGTWTHTPASSERGGPVDHCSDCSDAAREWVEWPCSAERIVKAAVEMDRYARSMDEGARLAAAVARADAAEAKVSAVERALGVYRVEGGVSCGGPTVESAGCFAADLARRVRRALADVPTSAPTGEARLAPPLSDETRGRLKGRPEGPRLALDAALADMTDDEGAR